jgi:hypothetical protein
MPIYRAFQSGQRVARPNPIPNIIPNLIPTMLRREML